MKSLFFSQQLRGLLLRSKQLAIFEACVIGLVSGLAAVLLKYGVGWLGGWRVQASHQFPAWIVLPTIGLIGGWVVGWVVERFAPEAAGSGIPQVKAALANVPIALDLRVAIVKLLSVILALGSGLNLGRQGPTVQVGAALASQLSRWIPTSPEYRRQLIAAGAAAGLAAGFNAPIAGVLFVMEELLRNFSGLALGTAILASFIGAVVSRVLGGQSVSLNLNLVEHETSFSLQDVPFFLILGVLAGLLGALFSRGIFVSLNFNRHGLRLSLPWRIALAGLVSGLATMIFPASFRDNTGLQESLNMGEASLSFTLLVFVVKFVLTLVAYGSGAPGGIFAPSLILGSALGYLVGLSAQHLEVLAGLPVGAPSALGSTTTYALAGMGAFFSAVTRGPITAIVMVFEITTDFNLVLPLMIGSVIAYLIADRVAGESFYNQLLAWNGIHLEPDSPSTPDSWVTLTAADLMQRRVETLSSSMGVSEVTQAFSRSHHRGFPVVDQGKLVGIVTQSDLADPSRHPADATELNLADIMTPQPVTVSPAAPLSKVLFLLNRFNLSRLPVTEGVKLVGIITRADIIRAEADRISGKTELGPQSEPSYVIYQTRSPATGKGRLLVPLSNPQTAPLLLKLAATIAYERQYELECLHIITIPRGTSPAETTVRSIGGRRLLRQAERLGQQWQIPLHTEIRVAHDAAQAVLEAIKERHIELILMGWKGSTTTPGRVFGSTVDTVIRQAACEVVLVKFAENPQFERWLVPIAGGPNSLEALKLLPGLITLAPHPQVRICQVFESAPSLIERDRMRRIVQEMGKVLSCPVLARPIQQGTVSSAITQLAWQERCDVIMVGASRDSLLQQVIKGNIPEAIARNSDLTIILVRGAIAP